MMVSDELLRRLELAAFECQSGLVGSREAFERALAPLPATWHEWAQIADERLLQLSYERGESAALQAALSEAEAKLEKVRAWRESEEGLCDLPQMTGLDAILDEP